MNDITRRYCERIKEASFIVLEDLCKEATARGENKDFGDAFVIEAVNGFLSVTLSVIGIKDSEKTRAALYAAVTKAVQEFKRKNKPDPRRN